MRLLCKGKINPKNAATPLIRKYVNRRGLALSKDVQQGTNIRERLLNKPYVNEVTLRGQKPPLKCC